MSTHAHAAATVQQPSRVLVTGRVLQAVTAQHPALVVARCAAYVGIHEPCCDGTDEVQDDVQAAVATHEY